MASKTVWIDLDNSPHVPFFAPIIDELERRGYAVMLTARDAYQVFELANFFRLHYSRVGRHYGKHRILKVAGTMIRSLQLVAAVAKMKPDLAVSHGSRSQIVASSLLKIPSLCLLDYEFTNSLAAFRPTWLLAPDIVAKSGAKNTRMPLLGYPGIKEDVYVPQFCPDPAIIDELGIGDSSLVVTVRPPANEAHYHNPEAEVLLDAVIERLNGLPAAKAILLPRNGRQAASLRRRWPHLFESGKILIPGRAVNGLNLIWHSDVVVSGGGTMNREAAALHVPVYSIFRGKLGAVDRYLAGSGRLMLLENVEDVMSKLMLERRNRSQTPTLPGASALNAVVGHIVRLLGGQPAERSNYQTRTRNA